MQIKKSLIKELFFLTLGSLLLALAVNYFIIPFKILSGGVAGVAVALEPLVSWSTTTIINVIIVVTFILGWIFLGKEFAAKTIFCSILYPVFLALLKHFPMEIDIPSSVASIYAGVLYGIGIGLVFKTGSSTGGMDVPPLILHKYTGISVAKLVMGVDALTILLGAGVYGIGAVLIGLLSVAVCGTVVDRVMVSRATKAKTVYIISPHYEEILTHIHRQLDRSATIISGVGGYSRENKAILLTVIHTEQYPTLEKLVNQVDPTAFMIVSEALEVHGEGFSYDVRI